MTLTEMKNSNPSRPIYAVLDGCSETADIGLYRKAVDDFQEDEALDWPDDWPKFVTVKFIREQGLEVITA